MTTRFSLILLLNVAGLALFFSWYLPVNHGFWFPLDSAIFHFFNQALAKSPAFLWLVAVTNNRAFDGCSLLAMGCLMLSFWLKEDKSGRRHILIIGLVMLLLAVVINQLATAIIPVKRSSPTLFFTDIYRVVAEVLTALKYDNVNDLDIILTIDSEARHAAQQQIARLVA